MVNNRLTSLTIQTMIVILFILIWQLSRSLNLVNKVFLASPAEILSGSWLHELPSFLAAFELTAYEVATAFVLSAVAGVASGIVLGQNDFVYKVIEPYIVWGYSIPKIAIYPVFMLLFGLGPNAVIAYGSTTAFFVILLNTIAGSHSVDPNLVVLSKSLGMSVSQQFSKILLPSMTPLIFSALRQGLIQAVLGVLLGELVLGTIGTGALIDTFSYSFHAVELYVIILIIALTTIALNFGLLYVESKLSFWRRY